MKKNFLIIASIIVLLIAGVGIWGYCKYFLPNSKVQQQLTNQFGSDFFTSFGNAGAANNAKSASNSGTASSTGAANNSKSSGNITPANSNALNIAGGTGQAAGSLGLTSPNTGNVSGPVTQEKIVAKYMPQINSLQAVAMSRLGTLYSAAVREYKQDKKAGTLNTSALAQKYIQAGNMLEANVDSRFNSILSAMQSELAANNLPTDEIGVIKSEYQRTKSQERSQLLAKALKG